jgi:3-phosphoinositide dependent protein kinase-1
MDDDNLFFVFENCENGDLADLIQQRKSLSLEVTRIYAAQMVQCLEYLQNKEVMHRDLKPQNLMLDADMNIKFVSS